MRPLYAITIGTVTTLWSFHIALISVAKSVYFDIFPAFVDCRLCGLGQAILIMKHVLLVLSSKIMSGLLQGILLSVIKQIATSSGR